MVNFFTKRHSRINYENALNLLITGTEKTTPDTTAAKKPKTGAKATNETAPKITNNIFIIASSDNTAKETTIPEGCELNPSGIKIK